MSLATLLTISTLLFKAYSNAHEEISISSLGEVVSNPASRRMPLLTSSKGSDLLSYINRMPPLR